MSSAGVISPCPGNLRVLYPSSARWWPVVARLLANSTLSRCGSQLTWVSSRARRGGLGGPVNVGGLAMSGSPVNLVHSGDLS